MCVARQVGDSSSGESRKPYSRVHLHFSKRFRVRKVDLAGRRQHPLKGSIQCSCMVYYTWSFKGLPRYHGFGVFAYSLVSYMAPLGNYSYSGFFNAKVVAFCCSFDQQPQAFRGFLEGLLGPLCCFRTFSCSDLYQPGT